MLKKVEFAPFLAEVLKSIGPQYGRWATNALPGQSWHQHGLAVDCFLLDGNGHAVWDAGNEGYRIYAEEAVKLGLVAGYFWKPRRDAVHVQKPKGKVLDQFTWQQLDVLMQEKFSNYNGKGK